MRVRLPLVAGAPRPAPRRSLAGPLRAPQRGCRVGDPACRAPLAALPLVLAAGIVALSIPARAQVVRRAPSTPGDRIRLTLNGGEQSSAAPLKETQTFQQYFEQGTLTLERKVTNRPFFDGGGAFRIVKQLHVGVSFSSFKDTRSGTLTAEVPNPLRFTQPRTTTGTVSGVERKENAVHIELSWRVKAAGGLEFMPFGGPSFFQTEQGLVTKLNLTLANEVYPYDTLAFPSVSTETIKDKMNGYNAGVDMAWMFSRHIGLGALIRYSHGTKDFTPTGGQAVKIEVGGLHAGGGLRVVF